MRRIVIWSTALILAVMPATALFAEKKGQNDAAPENAAVVNGKPIAYEDFQRERQLYQRHLQSRGIKPPGSEAQLNQQIINDMIGRELLLQASAKKGIKVSPEIVQEEISAFQLQFADRKQFEAWMTSMDLDEGILRQQIAQRQTIRQYIEDEIVPKVKITESEAKDYFTTNPSMFQVSEEVHAQHILIKLENGADERQKSEARQKIGELKKRLAAGEEFNELAKKYSDCPSAQNNGDLGFFSKGRMVPAFEKAAFDLKTGQVSEVVETQFGFHLIKVLDRKAAQNLNFEDVRSQIQEQLRNQKINVEIQKLVDNMRQKAKIQTLVN
jgi:peptidyl-prolyl cis-trans isomerase C